MITTQRIHEIIGAAWVEAKHRGIDPMLPSSAQAVTDIVVEMLEREMDRPRIEEEAAKAKELESYYKKNPHMHPDNWIGVIWPDGRAIYYRKDLGPPREVEEGLASGAARLLGKPATPAAPPPESPSDPATADSPPRRTKRHRPVN